MTENRRATMLKEATASAHSIAEGRSFMTLLMAGELCVDDYGQYLGQLAFVYESIEARPSRESDPSVLAIPHMARAARIRNDMRALGVVPVSPLPATLDYIDRIHQAWDAVPALVAHHYTRYLGDAAGGQVIARILQRHYGIEGEALTMYDFSDAGGVVRVRELFRAGLDELEFCEHQDALLVAEAKGAFDANSALFDELLPLAHAA